MWHSIVYDHSTFIFSVFLAENGTNCVLSNSERIASCLNDTMPQIEALLEDMMVLNQSLFDSTNCW